MSISTFRTTSIIGTPGYHAAYDKGAMDGFDRIHFASGAPECAYPYQYTNPYQITPYWDMADAIYAGRAHVHHARQRQLYGASGLNRRRRGGRPQYGAHRPSGLFGSTCHWGCDAPAGTFTHLITQGGFYLHKHGPFPCTNHFITNQHSYPTLRDLLDVNGVSWKYYVPPFNTTNGRL